MHGHHAEQVAARRVQREGILPAVHQFGDQRRQAGNLFRQVVGLNVDVVARRVIDCLETVNRPPTAPIKTVNCSSPGAGKAWAPSAADQKSTAASTFVAGVSIRIPTSRLRCMAASYQRCPIWHRRRERGLRLCRGSGQVKSIL